MTSAHAYLGMGSQVFIDCHVGQLDHGWRLVDIGHIDGELLVDEEGTDCIIIPTLYLRKTSMIIPTIYNIQYFSMTIYTQRMHLMIALHVCAKITTTQPWSAVALHTNSKEIDSFAMLDAWKRENQNSRSH